MDATALKAMMISLLTWIHVHEGFPMPSQLPKVEFIPHAELQKVVCNADCDALGFAPTDGTGVIYLDQSLDLDHNTCHRSILLHELVHYMQHQTGEFDSVAPEMRTHWKEMQALKVQRAYLNAHGRELFIGQNNGAMGLAYPYC